VKQGTCWLLEGTHAARRGQSALPGHPEKVLATPRPWLQAAILPEARCRGRLRVPVSRSRCSLAAVVSLTPRAHTRRWVVAVACPGRDPAAGGPEMRASCEAARSIWQDPGTLSAPIELRRALRPARGGGSLADARAGLIPGNPRCWAGLPTAGAALALPLQAVLGPGFALQQARQQGVQRGGQRGSSRRRMAAATPATRVFGSRRLDAAPPCCWPQ